MQIKNLNRECFISLANNEQISNTKISTENEHHRENSSILAKENNKDTETKNDEKEKPKLDNSDVKKTLILGDSIIKNVDDCRLNRRMKSIVLARSISGATTKIMNYHVIGCLEDESPDTILLHRRTIDLKNEDQLRRLRVT